MYAVPYLLLGLLLLFLYYNENRIITIVSVKKSRKIAFIIMLLFIGLRGHIYSDFINYYTFYNHLPDVYSLTRSSFTDWYFEPGFVLYSSIIKTIVPNYYGWVFLNTFIDLLVFYYVFNRYTYSSILPFLFFIAFNGLYIEFNLYRNVKAIDLFLISLPYLKRRKILPYMILNIIGMAFHTSSILYLPLFFILNKNIPKYIKWSGIIISNIIFIGQISIINDLINSLDIFQALRAFDSIANYTENSEVSYGISFGHIERTFGVILFTILYDKLCCQNDNNRIFYNCYWFYYIIFLTFYEVSVLTERVPLLFMFSYWILYPNVIALKLKYRQLILTVLIFLAFLKIYSSNTIPPAKYDNLIFGIEDYNSRKDTYDRYVSRNIH